MGVNYENLASTKMLATHCAVCGRPLLDATSVETGIGPDCRKKYGFDVVVDQAARAAANKLVHEIAITQRGPSVAVACERLRDLGFPKLAARILERCVDVTITLEDGLVVVKARYSEALTEAFRTIPGWFFRRGATRAENRSVFPKSQKDSVWAALRAVRYGESVMLPDGKIIELPRPKSTDLDKYIGPADVNY